MTPINFNSIFVSGIGTDVGKTIVSSILVKALNWDYWKPVQSGSLDFTDSNNISILTEASCTIHNEAFKLKEPLSPHAAAEIDGIDISLDEFSLPKTDKGLIIEGAGGLLVPLNRKDLVIDLIKKLNVPVILVSKNYLGSINHTLLSIEALNTRNIPILGIIFNGDENKATESIILKKSKLFNLGRIPFVEKVNSAFIKAQAQIIRTKLTEIGLTFNE